jgi:hypothetical protein
MVLVLLGRNSGSNEVGECPLFSSRAAGLAVPDRRRNSPRQRSVNDRRGPGQHLVDGGIGISVGWRRRTLYL